MHFNPLAIISPMGFNVLIKLLHWPRRNAQIHGRPLSLHGIRCLDSMRRPADNARMQGRIPLPNYNPRISAEGVVSQNRLQSGKQILGSRAVQVAERSAVCCLNPVTNTERWSATEKRAGKKKLSFPVNSAQA